MPIARPRKIACLASLAAAAALLAPMPQASTAAVTTVAPRADAWVVKLTPTTNYGTDTRLQVAGSTARRSYLRFGVPRLSTPVKKATLRLFARSSSASPTSVRGVDAPSWRERGLTWSNAPPVGAAVGSTGAIANGHWTAVDVTPLARSNKPLSVALTGGVSPARTFSSRVDPRRAPQLVIETEPPPPPDPVIAAAVDIACDPGSSSFNRGAGTATQCRQMATSDLLVGREPRSGPSGRPAIQYEDGTLSKFGQSYDPSWGG